MQTIQAKRSTGADYDPQTFQSLLEAALKNKQLYKKG